MFLYKPTINKKLNGKKMKNNIYMKNRIKYLVMLFLALTMYYGCSKDTDPVLYDEYKTAGSADPVVTSVSPANFAFAGLDTLTITGNNFSDSSHTLVYFDNVKATVFSVTPTQIKLKAPNLPKDNINIRVVVTTSSATAAPVTYALKEIQSVYYPKFTFGDAPVTITFDKQGNLYVSQTSKAAGVGVKKIDVNKNLTDYAPRGAESSWSGLKFAYGPYGANGQLFGARKNRGIWKINQGVAPTAAPWVGPTQGIDQNINDFDLDPAGNIWAAGAGTNIFRIKSDLTVVKYKYAATSKINAVRVFKAPDNTLYLYVGGTKDGKEGIWRYKIVNNEIAAGSEELYFDFAAAYPGKSVLGITFSIDGTMYVGTDADAAIITVSPSKSASAFLPGVIIPKFLSFVWDSYDKTNGQHLLYSRDVLSTETEKEFSAKLFSANTFTQGAPYYGLEL